MKNNSFTSRILLMLLCSILSIHSVFSQDISTGLLLKYTFDNVTGSTVNDDSGNNKTGTLMGGAAIVDGYTEKGVSCTPKNDYIAAPDNINEGISSFTFAAWVKLSSLKNATRFFDWGKGSAGENNFLCFVPSFDGDNKFMVLRFRPSSGTAYNVTSTEKCPVGEWAHVAVIYNWNGSTGTGTIYLNGEAVGSTSGIPYNPSSFLGNTTDNYFGYSRWSSDGNGFDGIFDEIHLFNRALTVADLDELVFNKTQLKVDLQSVIDEAEGLQNPTTDLTAAIASAKTALANPSTLSELKDAIANLTTSIEDYKLDTASPSNPLDMTDLIINPSFESSFTGWTNNGLLTQTNTAFPGKKGNIYVEKWVSRGLKVPDVSVQQTLADIPNGNYKLIAAAGNIQQASSGSTQNNSSTPQTGASLFAGLNNTAVNTIQDHSVDFVVADNEVTIGLKTEGATGNWVTCDNFRLLYTGRYDTDDYATYLGIFVNEAKLLLNLNVLTVVKEELNSAITVAEEAIAAQALVLEDLISAKEGLNLAVEAAELSINTYTELQEAIDYANNLMDWYSDDQAKIDKLQTAIDAANADYNNLDLTLSEVNKSIADLKAVTNTVDKKVYIANWKMGNVNDEDNNWSYVRSKEAKNWILFWEPGFGNNPGTIVDECLALAEKSFNYYADSLKFISKGSSKTDTYKMIILLKYTTVWEASGSGVDNTIGLLTLMPRALTSRGGQTIAHEVGHCFQYQVHCDNNDSNGWMYGFGNNASGGNGWWEQCAQWQSYKIFPSYQFTNEWFSGYMSNVHKHIIHEAPRYQNYFIQDYWCQLHGNDIIGRLWNESVKPEDPIETYKRITGVSQSQFNDEMFVCAARFASWDIPSLKSYGANTITSRPQPKMNDAGDDYWMIDPSVCPENFGHNIIKLNPTVGAKTVTAYFEGKATADGYRTLYKNYAGWRMGFVALKRDGTRVYGDVNSASMTQSEGKVSVSFVCPENCSRLWFIVTGAPTTYWRHAWDGDDTNDEQWPYQVKFNNTNLVGHTNVVNAITNSSIPEIRVYTKGNQLFIEEMPFHTHVKIFNMVGACVINKSVSNNTYSATLKSGVYVITVQSEDGIYTNKVIIR